MPNMDDIDLGIIGVVAIIVAVAILAAFRDLPTELYAFGSTGLAVVGSLVRGMGKKTNGESSNKPEINI